ncbi:transporter substrate-binding domain-containing protein [Marinobacter halodurans]|uniref:Transporter substrate-binding domain-containing protein n=1 Tax=Marinobacter halodurans TaxID=2528979 RepID=A0ABY1ZGD4_9GAMM|nr:transporter substrate-binding domain-containing protein [Marinobacter halodurans]TBW48236.1 transporter substrate-binding domain-containing protein [Marinobacter halodurans]
MRPFLLASLLLLALPSLADTQRVVVGVNNAPPYRIVDGNRFGGLYIDIFNEIGRQLHWDIVYKEAPFRRVLWMMENGQADFMLGPLKTDERDAYMDFVVQAFPAERRLFFFRDPENRITSYDDLQGRTIGVLRGSSYFPRFDSDDTLNKVTATRYENLMRMLEQRHVDVVIAPELVGLYTVEHFDIDVGVSPYTVEGKASWIAISRQSPLVLQADAVRDAMAQLSKTPRYHNLIRKYRAGVTDEPAMLQVSNHPTVRR